MALLAGCPPPRALAPTTPPSTRPFTDGQADLLIAAILFRRETGEETTARVAEQLQRALELQKAHLGLLEGAIERPRLKGSIDLLAAWNRTGALAARDLHQEARVRLRQIEECILDHTRLDPVAARIAGHHLDGAVSKRLAALFSDGQPRRAADLVEAFRAEDVSDPPVATDAESLSMLRGLALFAGSVSASDRNWVAELRSPRELRRSWLSLAGGRLAGDQWEADLYEHGILNRWLVIPPSHDAQTARACVGALLRCPQMAGAGAPGAGWRLSAEREIHTHVRAEAELPAFKELIAAHLGSPESLGLVILEEAYDPEPQLQPRARATQTEVRAAHRAQSLALRLRMRLETGLTTIDYVLPLGQSRARSPERRRQEAESQIEALGVDPRAMGTLAPESETWDGRAILQRRHAIDDQAPAVSRAAVLGDEGCSHPGAKWRPVVRAPGSSGVIHAQSLRCHRCMRAKVAVEPLHRSAPGLIRKPDAYLTVQAGFDALEGRPPVGSISELIERDGRADLRPAIYSTPSAVEPPTTGSVSSILSRGAR